MPKSLTHEEIAQRLVDAKVFDFHAMGKFITELGPALAVSDSGWHGVNRLVQHPGLHDAGDRRGAFGNLRTAGVANAALEGAVDATLAK